MTLPLFESYREIPLTQGQVALVDVEDYAQISKHKWYAKWNKEIKGYYAYRHITSTPGKQDTVLMHREILGLKKGDPREGEHRKQAQTLDNRRSNIRIATTAQNQRNQRRNAVNNTGFKGVTKRRYGGYEAGIRINGKKTYLGKFARSEDAARAYDQAAIKYFGEFAHTNFP